MPSREPPGARALVREASLVERVTQTKGGQRGRLGGKPFELEQVHVYGGVTEWRKGGREDIKEMHREEAGRKTV